MSQFISIQKDHAELSEYRSLLPLTKAKVTLGNKARKHLIDLGRSLEGMMVGDIFKELSQREQKIIESNMDTEADAAFEGMKKKLEVYGKVRRSTVFFN